MQWNMNWNDDYYNGHAANLSGITTHIPAWLYQLGWCELGLNLVVFHDDLIKAIPGLVIRSESDSACIMEIIPPPDDTSNLSAVIENLEETDFPFIALQSDFHVVCSRGLLTTSMTDSTDIVGEMWLVEGSKAKPGVAKYKLPRRMIICLHPGKAGLTSSSVVVRDFVVDATISCSVEFSNFRSMTGITMGTKPVVRQVSAAKSNRRLFGFFNS